MAPILKPIEERILGITGKTIVIGIAQENAETPIGLPEAIPIPNEPILALEEAVTPIVRKAPIAKPKMTMEQLMAKQHKELLEPINSLSSGVNRIVDSLDKLVVSIAY